MSGRYWAESVSEWMRVKLGDYVDLLAGYAFKSKNYSDNESAVSVLRGPEIKFGSVDMTDCVAWDRFPNDGLEKFELDSGDIVIGLNRPIVGGHLKWGVIRQAQLPILLNQRNVRLRAKPGLSQGFLRCIIGSNRLAKQIEMVMSGAHMPYIVPSHLKEYELDLPPISIQNGIASCIGALDNLIEINQRRIEILEETARLLYQEWFVNFRYPGHENVPLVDSELGPIPEGWDVAALSEMTSLIKRGISPKYDDDADCTVINQRCIRNKRIDLSAARSQSKIVPDEKYLRLGDVLVNSTGTGTLGRVAQVNKEIKNATVDSHVTILRPLDGCELSWFGQVAKALQPSFEALATGSTGQTELSRLLIGDLKICVPPLPMQAKFSGLVDSMHRGVEVLGDEAETLKAARDLLLPRLVSGELDVSDLDFEMVG